MKRIVVLFLAAALCLSFSACAMQGGDKSQLADTEESRAAENSAISEQSDNASATALLSDWLTHLYMSETYYGHMLWTLSYVESFLNEPTWDGLLTARMAAEAGAREAELFEPPEQTASNDDYSVLIGQGRDVAFVPSEIESGAASRQEVLALYSQLQKDLMAGVFWERNFNTLNEYVQLQKEILDTRLKYLAVTTDYLLNEFGDGALAETFREIEEESCPLIAAKQDSESYSRETYYARSNEVTDEMEGYILRVSEITGQMAAHNDIYADEIMSDDWSSLQDEAVFIDGLSVALPFPGWSNDGFDTVFTWTEEDGMQSFPLAGDTLDRPPDGCTVIYPGVAKEEMLNYRDELSELGMAYVETTENEDSSCSVTYKFGGKPLEFLWEDDTVYAIMPEGVICFAPLWYIFEIMLG
mgnify:CR=1 FL=1